MTTRCDDEKRPAGHGPLLAALVILVLGGVGSGCSGPQPIHHYEPKVAAQKVRNSGTPRSDLILAIEDFSSGSAYDDQRMVYRAADFRFDYYHFHRWAAPPGMLVSDTLREVYRETGAFRSVVGGYDSRADIILSGRVVAFEEVDKEKEWVGRVVINLRVRDSRTGELLWNDTLEREAPMPEKTPRGLASAISTGLTDIGIATTTSIIEAAKQRPMKKAGDDSSAGDGIFESSDGKQAAPDSAEPSSGEPVTTDQDSATPAD